LENPRGRWRWGRQKRPGADTNNFSTEAPRYDVHVRKKRSRRSTPSWGLFKSGGERTHSLPREKSEMGSPGLRTYGGNREVQAERRPFMVPKTKRKGPCRWVNGRNNVGGEGSQLIHQGGPTGADSISSLFSCSKIDLCE